MPAHGVSQRSGPRGYPGRGSVWQYGVRQDSWDWRAFGQITHFYVAHPKRVDATIGDLRYRRVSAYVESAT
jgi:hypothetical protein